MSSTKRNRGKEEKEKNFENTNVELLVKCYLKNKQPVIQQSKFKPPKCPSCKRISWLEFDERYACQNCEYLNIQQKHQINEKSSETISLRFY